ncbi:MAG: hypothetical protein ACRDSE_11990 [Pseudonocardiaceae bacterium]
MTIPSTSSDGLSVAVALLIVGFQLIGLVVERFGIITSPLAWIAGLDLGSVGYAIAGVFLLAWLLAVATWRLGRVGSDGHRKQRTGQ